MSSFRYGLVFELAVRSHFKGTLSCLMMRSLRLLKHNLLGSITGVFKYRFQGSLACLSLIYQEIQKFSFVSESQVP